MESIAIIGIGCRFPGADNPESFWQLFETGQQTISEVPQDRWNIDEFYDPDPDTPGKMNTRWGGFLKDIDQFDADFFGINPQEVAHIDPQQRLFLEVAWEALENAAIAPKNLAGSLTGVFTGLCTIDYHRLLYKDYSRISPYSGIGTTPCITANRLSYFLDLRGPSMAIDTACSSSLVTVHLACQSLRSGESDLCLAGGVNLILSPDSTISSSQTRLLSPSGTCKTFGADADGYVRGEGCGVVILKRLSDAVKDGDRILALIRGSAINQDGLSNSLSAPNGMAQEAVIRQALKNAQLQGNEIDYVDAHAVGTILGDAVEFQALKSTLGANRASDQPCWVSSVKPIIGHLEAAAGISALIKVVLALQNQKIPAHQPLNQLNPYISLENTPLAIPQEAIRWVRGQKPRFAGVSAFGFGGTNAHVILEEAPLTPSVNLSVNESSYHLLTLSAKSDRALKELAQRYQAFLKAHPDASLRDICLTANRGRNPLEKRLASVSSSIAQLSQQLQAFIYDQPRQGLFSGELKGRKRPKIAFFLPETSLSVQAELYQTQPIFRHGIDQCTEILNAYLEQMLLTSSQMGELASFSLQYALAQLWLGWGVKPKVLMGEGIGEYVAATLAGVFRLEDGLRLVAEKTRLQQSETAPEKSVKEFAGIAQKIAYSTPKVSLISSSGEEPTSENIATPAYWCRQFLKPQTVVGNMTEALAKYQAVLVMGSPSAAIADQVEICLSSIDPNQENSQEILSSLGELWVRGVDINWSNFDPDYQHHRLDLPTYPFQRQRYWFTSTDHELQIVPSQKVA